MKLMHTRFSLHTFARPMKFFVWKKKEKHIHTQHKMSQKYANAKNEQRMSVCFVKRGQEMKEPGRKCRAEQPRDY